MADIPPLRCRTANDKPLNRAGDYVLYWMTAYRRPFYNFALQQAVQRATELGKPLLIFEPLRCDYPHASLRLNRFILQGMAANQRAFTTTSASYYPYAEHQPGQVQALFEALSQRACLVVSDDFPGFIYPRIYQAVARQLPVLLELVDSNGLLPLAAATQAYPSAYAFRRFLQKELPRHLFDCPQSDPLAGVALPPLPPLPEELCQRWPATRDNQLNDPDFLLSLPFSQAIPAVTSAGGWPQAEQHLHRFLSDRLPRYLQRSEPALQVASELSPYLHFGHISTHQIIAELFAQESWSIARLAAETKGKRSGWWGLTPAAESFVDELISWRELSYNAARFLPDYSSYSSLPEWALTTLEKHRNDPRPILYTPEQLERAQTADRLWNAAQTQLLSEGRMHNYLRMLWGKKILEWSPDPETALRTMLTLNDRYALDGRDPNTVSGIFWCLGRYDRAWGPERPIFGKIRYMSSQNTARKFSLDDYLARYAPASPRQQSLF